MTSRDDSLVEARNLALAYRMAHTHVGTFKEYAIRLLKRQVAYERLWALDGVSFTLNRGEVLGVIGPNGAGKSTLMKIIARVLPPTRGRIIVRGSVAPMIELGAGFNPELTAYENIVLYGTLLGRDAPFMRGQAREIAEWAALTDFFDVPIRSYSSGMLARLGFAVATDCSPDVLVVDEVLAVGDESFQQKSRGRIASMIKAGTGVILVSHALETVERMATRVLWLDKGQVAMEGVPQKVVQAYRERVAAGGVGVQPPALAD